MILVRTDDQDCDYLNALLRLPYIYVYVCVRNHTRLERLLLLGVNHMVWLVFHRNNHFLTRKNQIHKLRQEKSAFSRNQSYKLRQENRRSRDSCSLSRTVHFELRARNVIFGLTTHVTRDVLNVFFAQDRGSRSTGANSRSRKKRVHCKHNKQETRE